jgi:hypothetical protein
MVVVIVVVITIVTIAIIIITIIIVTITAIVTIVVLKRGRVIHGSSAGKTRGWLKAHVIIVDFKLGWLALHHNLT